jgi:hypothetical protein
MVDEELDKREVEELIEDIFRFKKEKCPNFNTIDVIIEYAYQNDRDVQEIGNILGEHKEFVEIFEKQLKREKYIRTPDCDDFDDFDYNEW